MSDLACVGRFSEIQRQCRYLHQISDRHRCNSRIEMKTTIIFNFHIRTMPEVRVPAQGCFFGEAPCIPC
jgi:hypothetical protein